MPRLMGIVNVTPDSFSDGGQFLNTDHAVHHALQLVEDGADILDVGGESTRPGADEVNLDEELSRVLPVIETLARLTTIPISIDTRKHQVAVAAMAAGAQIWNDVSALTFSDTSLAVAARLECDIVLMHAKGQPQIMQDNPHYEDVVSEVINWLEARIHACECAGIERRRLMIDPGIGFGKTVDHNLALIAGLDRFHGLALPVVFGASRKKFIAELDRAQPPDRRVAGSVAAALIAARAGAAILRVHDVGETRQALVVDHALMQAKRG